MRGEDIFPLGSPKSPRMLHQIPGSIIHARYFGTGYGMSSVPGIMSVIIIIFVTSTKLLIRVVPEGMLLDPPHAICDAACRCTRDTHTSQRCKVSRRNFVWFSCCDLNEVVEAC